jgi:hypothetical protein
VNPLLVLSCSPLTRCVNKPLRDEWNEAGLELNCRWDDGRGRGTRVLACVACRGCTGATVWDLPGYRLYND